MVNGLDPGWQTDESFGCQRRRRISTRCDAGSNTELPASIQTRSCTPCPILTEQDRPPDSQGAWRLGQLVEESWLKQTEIDQGERKGLTTEEREELRKLHEENKILRVRSLPQGRSPRPTFSTVSSAQPATISQ